MGIGETIKNALGLGGQAASAAEPATPKPSAYAGLSDSDRQLVDVAAITQELHYLQGGMLDAARDATGIREEFSHPARLEKLQETGLEKLQQTRDAVADRHAHMTGQLRRTDPPPERPKTGYRDVSQVAAEVRMKARQVGGSANATPGPAKGNDTPRTPALNDGVQRPESKGRTVS